MAEIGQGIMVVGIAAIVIIGVPMLFVKAFKGK